MPYFGASLQLPNPSGHLILYLKQGDPTPALCHDFLVQLVVREDVMDNAAGNEVMETLRNQISPLQLLFAEL